MDMTPATFTPAMLVYLAALWLAIGKDARIASVLFACWAAGQAGVMINGGYAPTIWFVVIDFVAAMHLIFLVHSKDSRRVAFLFIPMITVNAAAYAQADPPLAWHYTVLFGLAWVQVLVAIWGAHRGGLIEVVDYLSRRTGLPLNRFSINKNKGA